MKRFLSVAVIPVFAGFLCAQTTTRTETTTTKTWNGTLVDEGCRTTQTERKETKTNEDQSTTTTKTETTRMDCPVSTTTTTFSLLTSEGKYVRFDEPSNTKIVEIVKSNKKWAKLINEHQPVRVRVVGAPNGDVFVLESIR